MNGFDVNDPFSWNAFDPPNTHVAPPAPRSKTPRLFPEVDRLFRCQKATTDVIGMLDAIKDGKIDHHEYAKLHKRAEDAYKLIRNYLYEYASTDV